ncbi:Glycerol-3-phosphate acyltransferase [Candidatus Erwinia haradaeae]|uniref:Glycerol-3-phosphate acyltransferase n=1 Tax=Candidatus Erwinia haradaeae TaxID=1922217 RepID=A0A451DCB9_9GAMM|nr:glycerol-3-phosphate 1-O-acyltransferase PlsB [Candidatus Erwinia haradaeae]VFP84082.1 Glycerol-3-phosphate acyltransferase [Candidatus Erwinia haradaeae]
MFIGGRSGHFFFNKLIQIFVHSQIFPNNVISTLDIDITRPMMYLLLDHSKIDLFTLREQCLQIDLPDPLEPLDIFGHTFPHYMYLQDFITTCAARVVKLSSLKILNDIVVLHDCYSELDIQVVPVSIIFGRFPGRERHTTSRTKRYLELFGFYKFFSVCFWGRDSVIRFLPKISIRDIIIKHGYNSDIINKLIRVAHIYFIRERVVTVGPHLLARRDLLEKLLKSKVIIHVIREEANKKHISPKIVQKNILFLIKEISANFSCIAIYFTDYLMSWVWRKLYQGIKIRGSQSVLQLSQSGHTIVYVPCHRSHMDYLLLSYILYHQGLFLPHIAAGINLNFWPVGMIFRYLGAFFIRREFRCNKLYSMVFREYLGELLQRGHSVEYFIEGGRSRSGYLRSPKTGMLLVTLQSMLRAGHRPISLVPIYIGYEHIIEVSAYTNELRGATKKKEGCISMVRGLGRLRNFGQSYINFGKPLSLVNYLDQRIPEWRECINQNSLQHPFWLTPVAHNIAQEIMIRINNAAAANAINLSVTAVLASQEHSLSRQQLTKQLECYLDLLHNVPYSPDATIPDMSAQELIEHALRMKKLTLQKDSLGQAVILPRESVRLLSYYRNNIYHMLVIPSLIATIIIKHKKVNRIELCRQVSILYPMLKNELFLRWQLDELPDVLDLLVSELVRQELVREDQGVINVREGGSDQLTLLAAGICDILQLYTIIFSILMHYPNITRKCLVKKSSIIVQILSVLCCMRALDFCDQSLLTSIICAIYDAGYIKDSIGSNDIQEMHTQNICIVLFDLVSQDVRMAIESAVRRDAHL